MVLSERIVAIISPDSAPVKRLVQDSRASRRLLDCTCGRRTRSVIVTDSDHIILSAVQTETIAAQMCIRDRYKYNVKGLLYWSVNAWSNGAEWRKIDAEFPYGDGRLIYCGKRYGLYGPIGSIRLEYLRDGIEDFQYLTMIEELYGREKADEIVARVTKGILDTHVAVSYTHLDVYKRQGMSIHTARIVMRSLFVFINKSPFRRARRPVGLIYCGVREL